MGRSGDGLSRQIAALGAAGLSTLVLVTSAEAAVHLVSVTSRVGRGDTARLTVTVAPTARCTIAVIYDTVVSRAKGLGPKRGGRITWSWRVGPATHPGRWPVVVDCGQSGKRRTSIVVHR
jgi:hypothetical protein